MLHSAPIGCGQLFPARAGLPSSEHVYLGRSMRLTLRMRQPVTRFTGGGIAPAINAHTHSRFERGTKKVKEGRGK